MFFYNSKVLNLVFVTTIVNAIDLTHDISDTKPIVFKILERNNKIIVQKDTTGVDVANGNDLKKFLNQNADLEYNIKNILKANKPFKRGQKRRLVKKIVPHGVDTSDGSRYFKSVGTFFKPLLKLHKTKKLESYPDGNRDSSGRDDALVSFRSVDAIPKLDQVQDQLESMNKYRSDIKNVKTADVAYGTKLPSETEHTMQHLSEMERLTSIMANPMLKEIARSKMSALRAQTEEVHSAILDLMSIAGESSSGGLRNLQSALDSDEVTPTPKVYHIAPGVDMTLVPDTEPTEYQCALYPHQPLWGFWQQKHTIYNEPCEEGYLIGNVCSKIHPHK